MVADGLPVLTGVLKLQRRSLMLWSLALAAVTAMYVGLYPSMGAAGQMQEMIDQLPEAMVTAFGYDQMGTAGGWITSTVYGLIAPVLMLVFAIAAGARLIAGQEEDGTLELELTAPVARRRIYGERLLALLAGVAVLVAVVTAVTLALVAGMDMDLPAVNLLAGSVALFLLVAGFGALALAVGAVTGRRSMALAVASAAAVLAFVFDAIGPTVDAGWMTAVSPFSWYLEESPLLHGFDLPGLVLLAAVGTVAGVAGLFGFLRRDLMV